MNFASAGDALFDPRPPEQRHRRVGVQERQDPRLLNSETPTSLEAAIWQTIRYFDLLELPLTAVQLWRGLLVSASGAAVGHGQYTLAEVRHALASSAWLAQRLQSQSGYVFRRGQSLLIHERLRRHRLAQEKWKILQRVVRYLRYVPFVRLLAGSGSLALYHTRASSDLDLFIVVRTGRIWTTRLFCLLLTQLSGRRRKYGDMQAPDKVCLNHYITDDSLHIAPEIRNAYTAILYTHLVPLTGAATYEQFQAANDGWYRRFLKNRFAPVLPSLWWRPRASLADWLVQQTEAVLAEPIWDFVERWAEAVQRRAILRHTLPGQSGRVVLSPAELAFHPDTKVPALLRQLQLRIEG